LTAERSLHANMDPPPAEGNFCDDSNRLVKPHIVERYNRQMVYLDSSKLMANSYSMSRRILKLTMKLFSHFLDLTVPKSRILFSSCGVKYTHRDFGVLLVRDLIAEAGKSHDRPTPSLVGRQYCATREPPKPTLTSEIIHQTSLPSVFISRAEQGHSV